MSDPWSQGYRLLKASNLVLRTELVFSGRAEFALNADPSLQSQVLTC